MVSLTSLFTTFFILVGSLGVSSVHTVTAIRFQGLTLHSNGESVSKLYSTELGRKYFGFAESEYVNEDWYNTPLPPGTYKIQDGDTPHVALVAKALLDLRAQYGRDFLISAAEHPLLRLVDKTHCQQKEIRGYIGLYWSEDKLYLDKNYCHVMGGGIWEAKM